MSGMPWSNVTNQFQTGPVSSESITGLFPGLFLGGTEPSASTGVVREISGSLWFLINADWNGTTFVQEFTTQASFGVQVTLTGVLYWTAAAVGGIVALPPITFLPAPGVPAANVYYSDRNKLINGGHAIDQRNNGASVTATGTGAASVFGVDRWKLFQLAGTATSKWAAQQIAFNALPTCGARFASILTSLATYAVAAGDQMIFQQPLEGQNVQDLGWGTASAKTMVLSVVAAVSVAGTYSIVIQNYAQTRSYVTTLALTVTPTLYTLLIPGDTGGAWVQSGTAGAATAGFNVGTGATASTATANAWQAGNFSNITGSTQLVATTGATLTVTAVQFETGLSATPFEVRSFGTELALCQRYYSKSYTQAVVPGAVSANGAGFHMRVPTASGTWSANSVCVFPATMRTIPTVTLFNPATGSSATTTNTRNFSVAGDLGLTPTNVGDSSFLALGSTIGVGYAVNDELASQWTASAEL